MMRYNLKLITIIISIFLVQMCATACAEVDFDSSQYSNDEPFEIVEVINKYLPKTLESEVLYNN